MIIPSLIETTTPVDPAHAFEFWRCTALQNVGHVSRPDAQETFSAKRLAAVSSHGTLMVTESSPVEVEGDARHVRQMDRDDVVIKIQLKGGAYVAQNGSGALIGVGDLSVITLDRPYAVGGLTPFQEIRYSVPRKVFEAQVGNADTLAGRRIQASPLSALFKTYLLSVAQTITGMSDVEAGLAIEGTLHLLRPLVLGQDGRRDRGITPPTLRSLAQVEIERRLSDPTFTPATMCSALNVSRTKLYAAFNGGEGVAGAIRDARLDRAHQTMSSPGSDGRSIASIAYACGFTDLPGFNRAFRRRFGMTPRDVRGLRNA